MLIQSSKSSWRQIICPLPESVLYLFCPNESGLSAPGIPSLDIELCISLYRLSSCMVLQVHRNHTGFFRDGGRMGQGMRAQAHYLLLHTVPELWQSLSWHSYFISVQADCLPMTDSIMTQLFIKMRAVVCPWWTCSWNSFASTRKQIVCCRQTPSWHSLLSAWGQIACPWQTESWHMPALFINTATDVS